ncbi:MAG: N-acetylglucosamine-6-phosphate deacetylase [Caulobacteraceae bacterium]
MKAITNADIIANNRVLKGYTLVFDKKIERITRDHELDKSVFEEIIDGNNNYLSPGFIDIHIHGCLGNDTMDGDEGSIYAISKNITSTGVTSFLPTTMTMELPIIEKTITRIRKLIDSEPGAEVLGCHLEGPFISDEYKGAQDGRYILKPDFNHIKDFSDVIKIVTIAPEQEGSDEFIENCVKHGIVVSIGHTNATYDEAVNAVLKGASHCTHTFNAMTPLHHREPGVVGAAMDSPVNCELIADNIHVNPAVQRILLKVKGIDRIVLITDAMRACLLEDGEYDLGGQKVLVKGGEARLSAGNLAGSVLTLDKALKNFINNTGADLLEAIKTITENPARILKVYDKKGSIDIGKDANLTLFDKNFNVCSTYVKGKKVYERLCHENSSIQGL